MMDNHYYSRKIEGISWGFISMSARAKHFGKQFVSHNQRFIAEMLRPYEYICINEMHPRLVTNRWVKAR
jgi:hypothetical protein